jgi:branched-chain amino acid transport system substrate-binding protein
VVEVALVATFSGPGGSADADALRNGLQVEADAVNARGGLLGATVEIVAADSAAGSAEAVRQQVGDGAVALLIGPDTTAGFESAASTLAAAGTPNCVVQVSDDALAGARSSFETGPSNRTEVAVLLDALRRARPEARRIGLLDDGGELGRARDAQLAAQAGGAGLTYVGRAIAGAEADPGAALQQLAGEGAQVVVLSEPSGAAGRAAQAAAQLGAGRPLLAGFDTVADPGFPTAGGDPAVGALMATTNRGYLTDVPPARWPAGYRAFVSAAERQFGLGTDGTRLLAAPAAGDCLLQWAHAVAAAGTFRSADVTRAWQTLDLAAAGTALGVREHLTPADHTSIGPSAMFAYAWTREGTRLRLTPI